MSLFTTSTEKMQYLNDHPDNRFHPEEASNQNQALDRASQFLNDLRRVTEEITLKSKPDGSRRFPARSCRDIADHYPQKTNGMNMNLVP